MPMDLTLVTKPGPETDTLAVDGLVEKHLHKKLEKIELRLGGKPLAARAVIEELPVGFEATISLNGRTELVGKAREPELLRAVDAALDKLSRQVDTRLDKASGKERGRRASSSQNKAGTVG
jgi:ribosome-associated translation inhibitor RaiA